MNLLVLRTLSDIDEAYRMAQEELAANRGETIGVCRQIIDEIDSSPHAVRNLERRFGRIVSDAHAERVCFEEEFDCVG